MSNRRSYSRGFVTRLFSSAMPLIAACVLLASCTSVKVRPIAAEEPIRSVLIETNPKVWRSDFIQVLQDGFARHGIESRVIQPGDAVGDAYVVRYTARQSWDMAMYMTDATVWIYRNDREIASAVFHLKGGGGLALTKWQGTAAKMDPVIDQLLADVSHTGKSSTTPAVATASLPAQKAPAQKATAPIDALCDMTAVVDRAECRGELQLGMTTNEILAGLGRPDETSADGTMLRYGDRYLSLDAKSRLVGISDQRPAGK